VQRLEGELFPYARVSELYRKGSNTFTTSGFSKAKGKVSLGFTKYHVMKTLHVPN